MRRLWQQFRENYRTILHYGVIAILIFVPLYPKFPLVPIAGSYVPVRLEDVLSLVVLGVWLVGNLGNWRRVVGDRLNQAVFLFWLAGMVSLASAIFVTKTVVPYIGVLHWLRRVEYMGLALVARDALREKRQLAVYVQVLMLVILGVAIFGAGQKWWGFPVISTQNLEFSKGIALRLAPGARLSSTFAGHYDLSAFCVLILPMVAGFVAVTRKLKQKLVWGFLFVVGLWLLLASASRISFPAAIGGVWVTLGILRRWRWLALVTIVAVLGSGLYGDLAERYQQVAKYETVKVINKVRKKLQVATPVVLAAEEEVTMLVVLAKEVVLPSPTPGPVVVNEDRSSSIRLNVEWPRAIRAFEKNPLLGTGMSSITLATDNDYLRLLGEVGLVGFVAFILVFLRLVNAAKKKIFGLGKDPDVAGVLVLGVVGATLGILVNATFIDVFEASKVAMVFWVLIGLAVASLELEEK